MTWKRGLFLTLFLFTLQASRMKDFSRDHLRRIRTIKYSHFYEESHPARHLSAVRDSFILKRLRVKRSSLFRTGVKACPEENMAEVIASHKSYYKLRVCQEAVWEAFQFFLDRVPDTTEFQQWVHACQTDSLCVEDLAHNFSSTQEHLDMVARRMRIQDNQKHAMATSGPGEKCSKTPEEKFAMDSEKKTKDSAVQHIIEFSVTVNCSQLQRNPESLQYQDLPHSLQEQMLRIFSKLAGFKEIQLLGVQSSPGSAAVRYAVVFETEADTTGIGSSGTVGEPGTEIALNDMLLKALREDTSLCLDIHSLNFEPSTLNNVRGLPPDKPSHLPGVISKQAAVLISEEPTESINNSEEEVSPNGAQGRDKETTESTFPTQETWYERNTILDSPSKESEVEQALGNEIAAMPSSSNLNSIKALRASTTNQCSESLDDKSDASFKEEMSVMPYFTPTEVPNVEDTADDTTGAMDGISKSAESSSFTGSSEIQSTNEPIELKRVSVVPRTDGTIQQMPSASVPVSTVSSDQPGNFLTKEGKAIQTHSSHQTTAWEYQDVTKDLPTDTNNHQAAVFSLDTDVAVFFSVQITNMIFAKELLNISSPGYTSLENTFLELRRSCESSNLSNPESSSKNPKKEERTLASVPVPVNFESFLLLSLLLTIASILTLFETY